MPSSYIESFPELIWYDLFNSPLIKMSNLTDQKLIFYLQVLLYYYYYEAPTIGVKSATKPYGGTNARRPKNGVNPITKPSR